VTLLIQRIKYGGNVTAYPTQCFGQHIETFDNLLWRMQPGIAQHVGQAECAHAVHGQAARLTAQLEENADHRQHAAHQRQHALDFFDIAANQGRGSFLRPELVAGLQSQRTHDLLFQPSTYFRGRRADLFSR
jgi:hypothetical protein